MNVPPEEMFEAFSRQYENRPDGRFLLAFETLVKRHEQLFGKKEGAESHSVGIVKTNGKEILVPLRQGSRVVVETRLPIHASFPEVLKALGEWAGAMDRSINSPAERLQIESAWTGLIDNAVRRIETPDPRVIASGLGLLDNCWRGGGRDARLLKAAALGYGMLLVVLDPDTLGTTDPLAAEGLAFLTLARRLDPDGESAREVALLARGMGYRRHSVELSRGRLTGPGSSHAKVLDAYLKRDHRLLADLGKGNARVIGSYLRAKLLREMGVGEEAEKASEEALKASPAPFYPLFVERIRTADVGAAKFFTLLYPMLLLDDVGVPEKPTSGEGAKPLAKRLEEAPDDKAPASLAVFEERIRKKVAAPDFLSLKIFMDAERLGRIYRCLYTEALRLRFELLHHRWAVPEKARAFAESVDPEKIGHPFAVFIQGRVAAERGDSKASDDLYERTIRDAGPGGELAYRSFVGMGSHLSRIRLLPVAARRLDGRPAHRFFRGDMFRRQKNQDIAEREINAALDEDPYLYEAYEWMAGVQGSGRTLIAAVEKNPAEFGLLRTAGSTLVHRSDPDSRRAGLAALQLAQSLQPTSLSVAMKRAWTLRRMGRYDEAIGIYDEWLAGHERKDLARIIANASRARNYIEKGDAGKALEILGSDWESYQATSMSVSALANEKAGKLDNAADLYKKRLERYSMHHESYTDLAGFHWRRGNHEEAAKVLAKGRTYSHEGASWYVDEFVGSLGGLPDGDLLNAAKRLKSNGATYWELRALSRRLSRENRKDAAFRIASDIDPPNTFLLLEARLFAYKILRADKGKAAAMDYLRRIVPGAEMMGPFAGALYEQGMFEEVLEFLKVPAPGAARPETREFTWLQRLTAWLALERKPAELAKEFDDLYGEPSSLGYHAVGRFLLGRISRKDLLKEIRNEKQRCEYSYYIGLERRLKGQFAEAAQWYQICRETLQSSNGEFHWADIELDWWSKLGTEKRNRLLGDDIEA
jgi:tetratricopeptide (TPR) repeat protein